MKTEIKKQNELFANALALKIVGEFEFLRFLIEETKMPENQAQEYLKVVKKFLLDFEQKILNKTKNYR